MSLTDLANLGEYITLVDEMIARTPEIEPSDMITRWQDAVSDLEGSDPDAMH